MMMIPMMRMNVQQANNSRRQRSSNTVSLETNALKGKNHQLLYQIALHSQSVATEMDYVLRHRFLSLRK